MIDLLGSRCWPAFVKQRDARRPSGPRNQPRTSSRADPHSETRIPYQRNSTALLCSLIPIRSYGRTPGAEHRGRFVGLGLGCDQASRRESTRSRWSSIRVHDSGPAGLGRAPVQATREPLRTPAGAEHESPTLILTRSDAPAVSGLATRRLSALPRHCCSATWRCCRWHCAGSHAGRGPDDRPSAGTTR